MVEKVWKNGKKVNELLEESHIIKESIVNKLKELYEGQVRLTESQPVRVKRCTHTDKCIGPPMKVLRNFDLESKLKNLTGTNSPIKAKKDIAKIVKQLEVQEIFCTSSPSLFSELAKIKLTDKKVLTWMKDTVAKKYPADDY